MNDSPARQSLVVILLLIALTLLVQNVAEAQITYLSNSTATPVPGSGHNYLGLLNETVSPASGGLSTRIDVPLPNGRGISLPFGFAYDSGGVHFATQFGWDTEQNIVTAGGWSYSVPFVTYADYDSVYQAYDGVWVTCNYQAGHMLRDSSGTRHVLGVSQGLVGSMCNDWYNTPGTEDFYRTSIDSVHQDLRVADAHGTVYAFAGPWYRIPSRLSPTQPSGGIALPSSIEDSNGNQITISGYQGTFSITDTLGSAVLSTSGFGSEGNTVSVRGLPNPYTLHWGTASSNYNANVTEVYSGGCVNFGPVQYSTPVVTAIDLPNGKQYRFEYDSTYGLINKIYYPTGGYVSYTWGLNPSAERQWFDYHDSNGSNWRCLYQFSTPAVISRSVSFDGSTVALEQDFTYSTNWGGPSADWISKQTTVTSHEYVGGVNSITQYNYQPMSVDPPPDVPTEPSVVPVEQTIYYKDGAGNVLRSITKNWQDQYLMTSEQTTLENGLTSLNTYAYGAGAQITQQDEYDWGSGAPGPLLRRTVTNYASLPTTPIYLAGPSIFDRPQNVIVCNTGDPCTTGSSNRVTETDFVYDEPGLAPTSATSHDYSNYGSGYLNRGNMTTKTQWLNTGGTSPTSHYGYDDTGQLVSFSDPMSHTTSYSYSDSYTEGAPPGNTNAYLTQVTHQSTGAQHIENFSYAYTDGQLTRATDQNGKQTSYIYADSLRRLTEVDYPDGGKTTYGYNDALPVTVSETRLATPDPSVVTSTEYSGLGQVKKTTIDNDPEGKTFVDYSYDGFGHMYTQSNPHRLGTNPTDGTTRYGYDPLGRVVSITKPDNNIVGSAYSGNCVTATDESLRSRQSCSDALGRVTGVTEPNESTGSLTTGAYHTYYTYDALGNLTYVNQQGDGSLPARNRSSAYDSLSRLLETTNPETGRICYGTVTGGTCNRDGYDADGNLLFRTDARGVRTTYSGYDGLHRLGMKTYSDGTGTVTYFYDQTSYNGLTIVNGIGRRTGMSDGSGFSAWSYDEMGRVRNQRQKIATVFGNIAYTYNKAGALSSLLYPSGRTVQYTNSSAGRVLSMVDAAGILYNNYVTNAHYAPPGQLTSATHGDGITESNSFNNRLQPTILSVASRSMTLMSLSYIYDQGAGRNNGDIIRIANNRDSTRSTAFTYDQVNRLGSARTYNASTWGDAYVYDPFGNLLQKNVTQGTAETLNVTVNANNRINGFTYDAAGNMTWDAGNQNLLLYDAENRMSPNSGGQTVYTYDGDGHRVKTLVGGATTLYWYDINSRPISVGDGAGAIKRDYIFFGGKRIGFTSLTSGNTHYYYDDHLGSASVISNGDGSSIEWEADYYPFGTKRVINNFLDTFFLFTGYEFDYETGYYYAGARHDSPNLGRFMSPDWSDSPQAVPFAELGDPQSLNLYSYVRNNPLNHTDPLGHYEVNAANCAADNTKCQKRYNKVTQRFEQARQKDLRSKDPKVRAAAAAFGDAGVKNGVHVGFADLRQNQIKGSVDPTNSGKGKLIDVQVTIDQGLKGKSLQETIAHEGSHVNDDINFLTSYDFNSGRYNPVANVTHGESEFRAFQTGAGVTREHGFGPNDTQAIQNFLHNSPVYGPTYNVPVFSPTDSNFPQ